MSKIFQSEFSLKKAFTAFLAAVLFVSASTSCFAKSDDDAKKKREYLELINSVFDYVSRNYVDEIDPKVLYEGAMKGMLESVNDPYTTYLNARDWSSLSDTTVGNFGGVGLSITKPAVSTPEKPAYVEVASPIEDSPGYKAGIQSGDLIIAINGEDTAPITMDEVLSKLRGTVGESVTVTIRRGQNMEFDKTLVRAVIEVPTVKYGMINYGAVKNAGYLRIIEFTPKTAERVQEALDSFKKNNFTSLIIDLRNNPGGLITSVVDVADKFIDDGPIVSTKSRLPYENSVFTASPSKTVMPKGLPVIVMINKGSASASEILSGALKDDHIAYLVGERTYGKGSVQQPIPLPNNDGFKMTVARYYSPSDTNIDKIGIPPDLEVLYPEFSADEEKAFTELVKDDVISKYVAVHPKMTEAQISSYADTLALTYKLEKRLIRKLVRNEVERAQPARLYDMDYDTQLKEALKVIEKGNFQNLVKQTKTLKELQKEAEAKAEKQNKSSN